MKKLFQLLTVAAAMVVCISAAGLAQDVSRTPQGIDPSRSSSATEAKIVVLSGCLERGPAADEYSLREGTDVWELKSSSVNLGGHVYQTVIVTAVATNDPDGVLKVIALSMDTNSCN